MQNGQVAENKAKTKTKQKPQAGNHKANTSSKPNKINKEKTINNSKKRI
jgi:hypothetical protein